MADLKSRQLIYLKGFLFLMILLFAGGLILFETRSWQIAALLLLVVWSSARLYYFMFYVIEKYVDPEYKFAGIGSFLQYLFSNRRK
ncbi:hypothetical protein FYZ48_19340 [Gimesia chilikensis]|uniref:hypothetical protein n=1 Tax=Gimesia chilikensis TaxID=2605989 RepID=UPI0011ED0E0A|nr:hypothetical protein [Gimesia chilikensis]KAA0134999.1 hypothetical protein FYZ48_19340 [Gimesia chilikensis]